MVSRWKRVKTLAHYIVEALGMSVIGAALVHLESMYLTPVDTLQQMLGIQEAHGISGWVWLSGWVMAGGWFVRWLIGRANLSLGYAALCAAVGAWAFLYRTPELPYAHDSTIWTALAIGCTLISALWLVLRFANESFWKPEEE